MSSILCIGNYGSGTENQYKIALLMEFLYTKFSYKFILGLGNNILPNGVNSINDMQFKDKFENPFKEILEKVKFYNILGTSDYSTRKSINSELNYGTINKQWVLPHHFYCFKKMVNNIPIEFIMIDSNMTKMKNKKTQEVWAINTLLDSRSRWNILVTHHPWFSSSNYICDDELNELFKKLNNTKKVDLIISAHENNQQHIYIPNKPNMIISGVGSQNKHYPVIKLFKQLKFKSEELGCVIIEPYKNKLDISFYNINKSKLNNFSIHKY